MTCPWTSSSENHIPQHVVPQDIKKLILIFDNKNTFKSPKFMTIYTHRDYEAEPYHCQEQKLSYVQTVAPDPYTWSIGPRKLAQLPSWIINIPNEVNNPFSITPDRNPDQTKLQFSNSVWWNMQGFLICLVRKIFYHYPSVNDFGKLGTWDFVIVSDLVQSSSQTCMRSKCTKDSLWLLSIFLSVQMNAWYHFSKARAGLNFSDAEIFH